MKTDEEILQLNSHIPSETILRDLAETQAEIAQMKTEIEYYEKSPQGCVTYRLDQMRAASRRQGVKEREEFIAKLEHLLALRQVSK